MKHQSASIIASVFAVFCIEAASLPAQDPVQPTASELLDSSYAAMVSADLARDNGDTAKALDGYRKAISGFISISQRNPELDPEVVRFRMAYCDNQIETLMKEQGINGSQLPATPKEREKLAPSPVQTASAAAEASAMQIRIIRDKIQKRELTGAREALLGMLRQSPDDEDVRILLATVQCMLGRFEDAENILTSLAGDKPDLARVYPLLATAQIGTGKKKEAKAALEKAISLGTHSPEVFFNLTQLILSTKPLDIEAARTSYRTCIQLGGEKDPSLDYLLK